MKQLLFLASFQYISSGDHIIPFLEWRIKQARANISNLQSDNYYLNKRLEELERKFDDISGNLTQNNSQ